MHWNKIGHLLGFLLILFSTAVLLPLGVSLYYGDGGVEAFGVAYLLILGSGSLLWRFASLGDLELHHRDGFLLVTLAWLVLTLFGAVPLFWSGATPTFTDAFFESMSGLTTTGATVITELDGLPHAIQFWRQEMQWLGGMGIIILAVAVLPVLRVGGIQLYKAEVPGPVKNQKLTPRVTETAKALWMIYAGLTVLAAVSFWLAGMSPFDAVSHSFSTVSAGGFSPHDTSIAYFQNTLVEYLVILFMFLGGVNFALHFSFLRSLRHMVLPTYLQDPEFRTYALLHLLVFGLVFVFLAGHETYPTLEENFRRTLFQTVSIGTTTGFATADYGDWPSLVPVVLLLSGFVMACAGSTGGGIKVIRFLLLIKQGLRQSYLLIHPHAVAPIRLRGHAVPEAVIQGVWGFAAVYGSTFVILMLTMLALGEGIVTAGGAVGATLTNIGPGLGEVGPQENYASISQSGKWVLALAMLMGRLELFTVFVLLMPSFWRK